MQVLAKDFAVSWMFGKCIRTVCITCINYDSGYIKFMQNYV